MSARLDAARRLELTGLVEKDDAVTGMCGDVQVTVADQRMSLLVADSVHWKWIHATGGEPNSPDVVTREPIAVLAWPGRAPFIEALLNHPGLHAALAAFYRAHPLAAVEEGVLHVPEVGAAVLKEGVALVRLLREAMAAVPVTLEAAPVLPSAPSWWKRLGGAGPTLGAGVGVVAIYGGWLAAFGMLPREEAVVVSIAIFGSVVGTMIAFIGRPGSRKK